MSGYRFYLFRQLSIEHDDFQPAELDSHKAQELLCYLLVHRQRPHARERLADLLWPDTSPTHAKRYLRQALWQLQTTMQQGLAEGQLLAASPEWIELADCSRLWIDVDIFEGAYEVVKGLGGRQLSGEHVDTLREVVSLYRGDLLENWYQDWCIFERERLQNIYLMVLDKLIGYCEATRAYEDGISFGTRILASDQAHERTFRRLMRLHYFAGNRTAALRLYRRCQSILHDELGVEPAERTQELYRRIQEDRLDDPTPPLSQESDRKKPDSMARLRLIRKSLAFAQNLVDKEIAARRTAATPH